MAGEEQEQGYEIVDKRKVKLDEDGEVVTNPDAEETQPPATEEETEFGPDLSGLPPADVYSVLRSFIGMLAGGAWQWMGLMKDPVTGKLDKDLKQAKVAIDAVTALAGLLESAADPAEQRELKAMISDLQINFFRQSSG